MITDVRVTSRMLLVVLAVARVFKRMAQLVQSRALLHKQDEKGQPDEEDGVTAHA